jgi:hypothetical protein
MTEAANNSNFSRVVPHLPANDDSSDEFFDCVSVPASQQQDLDNEGASAAAHPPSYPASYGRWSEVVRTSSLPRETTAPSALLSADESKDFADPFSRCYNATRHGPLQALWNGETVKGLGTSFQLFAPPPKNYEESLTEINEQTALFEKVSGKPLPVAPTNAPGQARGQQPLVDAEKLKALNDLKDKTDEDLAKFKTKISHFSIFQALLYFSGTVETDQAPILSLVKAAETETLTTGQSPSFWKIFNESYGEKMSTIGYITAGLIYFLFCDRIPVIPNIVDAYLDNVLRKMRSNLKDHAGRRTEFIDNFIKRSNAVFDVYNGAIETWANANPREWDLDTYRMHAVRGLFWKGETEEKKAKAKDAFYRELSAAIVDRFAPDVDFGFAPYYLGFIDGLINIWVRFLLRNQILPSALENITNQSQKATAQHNIPFFRALAENLVKQIKKIDKTFTNDSSEPITQPVEAVRSFEAIGAKVLEAINMAPFTATTAKAREGFALKENPGFLDPLVQKGLQTGIALGVDQFSDQERVENIFDILFDALNDAMVRSLPGNTEMNSEEFWNEEKIKKESAFLQLYKSVPELAAKIVEKAVLDLSRGGASSEATEKHAQNIFKEHKMRAEKTVQQLLPASQTIKQKIDPGEANIHPHVLAIKDLQKKYDLYSDLKTELEGLKEAFETIEKDKSLPQLESNRIEAHLAKIRELAPGLNIRVFERRLGQIKQALTKIAETERYFAILAPVLAPEGLLDHLTSIENNYMPEERSACIAAIKEQIRVAGFSREDRNEVDALFLMANNYSNLSGVPLNFEQDVLEPIRGLANARKNHLEQERGEATRLLEKKSKTAYEKCAEGIAKVSLLRVEKWNQMKELEIDLHENNSIHPELTAFASALSAFEKTERVERDKEERNAPLPPADKNSILDALNPIYEGSIYVMEEVLALQHSQNKFTLYFKLKIAFEEIRAAFETIEANKSPPTPPKDSFRVLEQEIKRMEIQLATIKTLYRELDPQISKEALPAFRALEGKVAKIKKDAEVIAEIEKSLTILEGIQPFPKEREAEQKGLLSQLISTIKNPYNPLDRYLRRGECVTMIKDDVGNVGFEPEDRDRVRALVDQFNDNYSSLAEPRFSQEIWNPLRELLEERKTRLQEERAVATRLINESYQDPYAQCIGEVKNIGLLKNEVLNQMKVEREGLQVCTDALKKTVTESKKAFVPTLANPDLGLMGCVAGAVVGALGTAAALSTGYSPAILPTLATAIAAVVDSAPNMAQGSRQSYAKTALFALGTGILTRFAPEYLGLAGTVAISALATGAASGFAAANAIPQGVKTSVAIASPKVKKLTKGALEELLNPAIVSGIVNQLFLAIVDTFPTIR